MIKELTQKELKRVVHYDELTGVFTRKVTLAYGYPKGTATGTKIGSGYLSIQIHGKPYLAHRLTWLYMTGEFPPNQVDHRDHVRTNNKWSNLRLATNSTNQRNITLQKNNKSGVTGVWWNSKERHYHVSIHADGKQQYGGIFRDFFEAICRRKSLENVHKYHPNHGLRKPLITQ